MNDFVTKKLAEVEAFCKTSGTIIEKAGDGFSKKYGELAAILDELAAQTVAGVVTVEQHDVFDAKLQKTEAKLSDMMELYIGDDWDNPVEVLEWCSFFTGAASAHCALASELEDDVQDQLAGMSERFEDALHQVINDLRGVGTERKHASA